MKSGFFFFKKVDAVLRYEFSFCITRDDFKHRWE